MFREVLVVEVGEVLRQWQMGRTQRGIARMVGLDRKTVAQQLAAARPTGRPRSELGGVGQPAGPFGRAVGGVPSDDQDPGGCWAPDRS